MVRNPFPFFHLQSAAFDLADLGSLTSAQLASAWILHPDYNEATHLRKIKKLWRARREKGRALLSLEGEERGIGVYATREERQVDPFAGFELIDLGFEFDPDDLDALSSAQLAALPFHPDFKEEYGWRAERLFTGRRERDLNRGLTVPSLSDPIPPAVDERLNVSLRATFPPTPAPVPPPEPPAPEPQPPLPPPSFASASASIQTPPRTFSDPPPAPSSSRLPPTGPKADRVKLTHSKNGNNWGMRATPVASTSTPPAAATANAAWASPRPKDPLPWAPPHPPSQPPNPLLPPSMSSSPKPRADKVLPARPAAKAPTKRAPVVVKTVTRLVSVPKGKNPPPPPPPPVASTSTPKPPPPRPPPREKSPTPAPPTPTSPVPAPRPIPIPPHRLQMFAYDFPSMPSPSKKRKPDTDFPPDTPVSISRGEPRFPRGPSAQDARWIASIFSSFAAEVQRAVEAGEYDQKPFVPELSPIGSGSELSSLTESEDDGDDERVIELDSESDEEEVPLAVLLGAMKEEDSEIHFAEDEEDDEEPPSTEPVLPEAVAAEEEGDDARASKRPRLDGDVVGSLDSTEPPLQAATPPPLESASAPPSPLAKDEPDQSATELVFADDSEDVPMDLDSEDESVPLSISRVASPAVPAVAPASANVPPAAVLPPANGALSVELPSTSILLSVQPSPASVELVSSDPDLLSVDSSLTATSPDLTASSTAPDAPIVQSATANTSPPHPEPFEIAFSAPLSSEAELALAAEVAVLDAIPSFLPPFPPPIPSLSQQPNIPPSSTILHESTTALDPPLAPDAGPACTDELMLDVEPSVIDVPASTVESLGDFVEASTVSEEVTSAIDPATNEAANAPSPQAPRRSASPPLALPSLPTEGNDVNDPIIKSEPVDEEPLSPAPLGPRGRPSAAGIWDTLVPVSAGESTLRLSGGRSDSSSPERSPSPSPPPAPLLQNPEACAEAFLNEMAELLGLDNLRHGSPDIGKILSHPSLPPRPWAPAYPPLPPGFATTKPSVAVPSSLVSTWTLRYVSGLPNLSFSLKQALAVITPPHLPIPVALRSLGPKKASWLAAYRTEGDANLALKGLADVKVPKTDKLLTCTDTITASLSKKPWTWSETTADYRAALRDADSRRERPPTPAPVSAPRPRSPSLPPAPSPPPQSFASVPLASRFAPRQPSPSAAVASYSYDDLPASLSSSLVTLKLNNLPAHATLSSVLSYFANAPIVGFALLVGQSTQKGPPVRLQKGAKGSLGASPNACWLAFKTEYDRRSTTKSHIASKRFPGANNMMWYNDAEVRERPWRWSEMTQAFVDRHNGPERAALPRSPPPAPMRQWGDASSSSAKRSRSPYEEQPAKRGRDRSPSPELVRLRHDDPPPPPSALRHETQLLSGAFPESAAASSPLAKSPSSQPFAPPPHEWLSRAALERECHLESTSVFISRP